MILALALACGPDPDLTAPEVVTVSLHLDDIAAAGSLVASDGTTHDVKLSPAIVIVHDAAFVPFAAGEAASAGLERLAEAGDASVWAGALAEEPAVSAVDAITKLDDATYEAGPFFPGDGAFVVLDVPGTAMITVAAMFGESNDVFVAATAPVWDGAAVTYGEWPLGLFDAGTEVNQEPGLGADQAPRQADADQGAAEGGVIAGIDGTDAAGFGYPAPEAFARLTAVDP